jgi:hypothetical protein
MNFSKLSKEKKTQFVLVIVGTVVALNLLGFGLIRGQYSNLKQLAERRATADHKLQQMQDAMKHSDLLAASLADSKATLSDLETDMASGDLYSWVVNTFRRFKSPYKVEIPQLGPLGPITDVSLLPAFPYKQATLTVAGKAHFHDFGRFLADFENTFPHMRVLNLNLEIEPGPQDPELIAFRMEVAILVKTNPA